MSKKEKIKGYGLSTKCVCGHHRTSHPKDEYCSGIKCNCHIYGQSIFFSLRDKNGYTHKLNPTRHGKVWEIVRNKHSSSGSLKVFSRSGKMSLDKYSIYLGPEISIGKTLYGLRISDIWYTNERIFIYMV